MRFHVPQPFPSAGPFIGDSSQPVKLQVARRPHPSAFPQGWRRAPGTALAPLIARFIQDSSSSVKMKMARCPWYPRSQGHIYFSHLAGAGPLEGNLARLRGKRKSRRESTISGARKEVQLRGREMNGEILTKWSRSPKAGGGVVPEGTVSISTKPKGPPPTTRASFRRCNLPSVSGGHGSRPHPR